MKKSANLRLILDAHASIAFLAGAVLDLKSGVQTHLVQKGRVGARTWRADDGSAASGPRFDIATNSLGPGSEIAIAISVSQSAIAQARAYVALSARMWDADLLRYANRTRPTERGWRRACRHRSPNRYPITFGC